jgi:Mn-dependent DtxR family transcriptional regulator
MKTPYYEMYTDEGNAAVHEIVAVAYRINISWKVVMQMLEKLSNVKGFEEATDTAVRDAVWFALSRRLNNAS